MREPPGQHRPGRAVAGAAGAQLRHHLGRLVRRHPVGAGAAGQRQRRGGLGDVRPDGPGQHRRHPRVALEHRDRDVVLPAHPHAGPDEAVDRRVRDRHLAERRQHRRHVVEERRVRPDDEDAGPLQPLPVRVEQPGRAVQADRGLAGPGRALHADGRADVGPHDDVLLRLDRRDDVPHRPDPRPLDLPGQDRAPARSPALEQPLVLVRRDPPVLDAEPAAPLDAHRVGPAGPVEGAGDVGPPVDDDRVAALVGDVPAADVPALAAGVVGAAEEQRGRRVVDERGGAAVQRGREVLGGDPVAALHLQGEGALAHPGQVAAGVGQVLLLAGELDVGGHVAPRYRRLPPDLRYRRDVVASSSAPAK